MSNFTLSKIGLFLLLTTVFLITPVMAIWIFTETPPEPQAEELVIEMNEFEYAPIVTLPGAPIVTTPEETEPPTPPEESTPDPGVTPPGPEETTPEETTPEESTTRPPIIQPELDGTNHYNLITMIVGSLQECKDLGIEEGYYIANLNYSESYLQNDMIDRNKHTMHSAHTSSSGGNIVGDLDNANVHKLHFSVVMNSAEDEVVVYSYEAVGKSDEGRTITVYRTIGRYGVVDGVTRWYPDLYSVQVGTAKVVKQSGKQIIDINSFVVTPQN